MLGKYINVSGTNIKKTFSDEESKLLMLPRRMTRMSVVVHQITTKAILYK